MFDPTFVRQGLYLQQLPVYESEIPYIIHQLGTVQQAKLALKYFPHLNEEVPITIVDKERMQ
mgnify:CR=1 FL=1